MKALILEDNISYVWDYEMILEKLDVKVMGVHKTWIDMMGDLRKDPPDFMIIDLLLDQNEKGLDFIREVRNMYIPMIVCTGYPEDQFMDEAMKYGVKAFFSKPLDKAAFTYELKKLIKELSSQAASKKYLTAKDKGVVVRVPLHKIYKVVIDGNYSYVFTESGKKFVLKISLKKMLPLLDESEFIRCHRSTVVNKRFISQLDVSNSKLGLSNGEWVELGNKFKADVKQFFLKE